MLRPCRRGWLAHSRAQSLLGLPLFHAESCFVCHSIGGFGGIRGPDLTHIACRYTEEQMIVRMVNGASNMPAYTSILSPGQLQDIVAFLRTRQ